MTNDVPYHKDDFAGPHVVVEDKWTRALDASLKSPSRDSEQSLEVKNVFTPEDKAEIGDILDKLDIKQAAGGRGVQ